MTAVGKPPVEPRLQPTPLAKGLTTSPDATQADSQPIRIAVDRLALTRRAHRILREHFVRAAVRVSVLLAGDALALLLLRALLRGVRDYAWLGEGMSSIAFQIIPKGAVPLVQLLPAILLGLIALDTYGASDRRRDASRLVAGATLGLALPFWGHLWSNFTPLALPGFILLAALIGTTLIAERHVIDHIVRKLWPIGPGAVRALLIGRPADAARALEHPGLADAREFTFGGVLDPDELGLKNRGGFRRLCQTIKRYRADTLVLSGPLDDDALGLLIEAAGAAGCQLYALPRVFALGGVEAQVVWRRGAPLMALSRPGLRARQLILKRTLDIAASGLGLLLLSPIFLLIALAVRISGPGPILFRQERVGLGGKTFRIAKFRSMVHDAESKRSDLAERSLYTDLRLFKVKDDPRVTRVGAFLRRTSLDELPQLWNVFVGDMSLVGPRPPLPAEVDLYEEHHYTRFDVKPGMTGPWQVNGRNLITDFEEVVRLETDYIREWTIWKDLGLLLKTIPAVLYMRGAS
ncbi:MAG TPA: exopolysaccharide biosynthesis polyprenyl glycosylphosphotransferase [Gemmatimonadales bacterium]|nr:exopolysaccharide biosynthesis polyprenyl glycosylphosphotransferase [Gemmatimonadales bacterium]